MPTPGSGAISMNDMRTNINRATSSSISMSEMRNRYGGSGAISFNDLRNCEGFTLNPVRYNTGGKVPADLDGWQDDLYGSISPDENSGRVQFAANSFVYQIAESVTYSAGTTNINIDASPVGATQNGDLVTAGFKTTNLTRVVLANTARTITGATSNSTLSTASVSYDMPTSGTIHCLFKF